MDVEIKPHSLPDVHHWKNRPREPRLWSASASFPVNVLALKIYTGITMHLSSRGILELDICAAISYQPSSGTVNAFLHGCTSDQQTEVRAQLQHLSILAGDPLLLPVILVEMRMNTIKGLEQKLWNLLLAVETRSGQTGAPAINAEKYQKINSSAEWEKIAVDALTVRQIAPSAEDHARALLLTIKEMEKVLDDLNGLAESIREDCIKRSRRMVSEKLRFLSHGAQVVIGRIQYIVKRAEVQQSAVCSFATRRKLAIRHWLMNFQGL
jgi:hypothetical protein